MQREKINTKCIDIFNYKLLIIYFQNYFVSSAIAYY